MNYVNFLQHRKTLIFFLQDMAVMCNTVMKTLCHVRHLRVTKFSDEKNNVRYTT